MKTTHNNDYPSDKIIEFFLSVFTQSEGLYEGKLVAGLANRLLSLTPKDDIHVFTIENDRELIGTAIFSRLLYSDDMRDVFILSPMAVASKKQGSGYGQKLISNAKQTLYNDGVDVIMTYGDPNFYSKVGFLPISQDIALSPLPLSQPEGWLGQSLSRETLSPLKGACRCVEALNNPDIW